MIKSIRHLSGTESEWDTHNLVVPDGEISILKTKGGNKKIKIGNGTDRFSELPSLTGDAVKTDAIAITLMHGKSYRLGVAAALELSFPDVIDDDYYSEISFDSGTDATEFSVSGSLRLTGDDVADEELLPKTNYHYTVFIWYDGDFQGVVRGLPND
ncbi:MAG: hypothetical protein IJY23_06615 [Clostridia bacterium]|nr:hypothetical protein [Clostridia bacterium]